MGEIMGKEAILSGPFVKEKALKVHENLREEVG